MPTLFYRTIILKRLFISNKTNDRMAGGFAYIEKNGDWILENDEQDHGAFKAYRCILNKWAD
jgi:hypothetical protein